MTRTHVENRPRTLERLRRLASRLIAIDSVGRNPSGALTYGNVYQRYLICVGGSCSDRRGMHSREPQCGWGGHNPVQHCADPFGVGGNCAPLKLRGRRSSVRKRLGLLLGLSLKDRTVSAEADQIRPLSATVERALGLPTIFYQAP
jgi:hypothetical protein